ncbi:hypothetical protein DR094_01535 [Mycoplasma flocculare]|uniref:Uncharacterized protein n=1 Tax=Mesomycoplasma flocculare TaxID=2128 RepID=A0AAW9XBQ3_MESFC|nr:hypothetical protein [Mesomycoplasma flocculare]MXR05848.1 hypothetical protein [Mesomycoplasma flocculare]MXR12260.1 hypothetical protein [Mesomycoplasma flocculare]MXR39439.1 hypothetical protein [Mycoplasma sp. MF12]MXR56674.1 hypothetical protein [Mesomycoplasma flocculare]
MKLKIYLEIKNKSEIKRFIKLNTKFKNYRQILGKKFKFLFYNLCKILQVEASNYECAALDLNLISNIDKIDNWICCMSQFLSKNLLINFRIYKNLATFLYYSWKIHSQKFSFKSKLSNYEDLRRDAFNSLSIEWIRVDPKFNIKIIEILRRWK